jgi:hypothetical protein
MKIKEFDNPGKLMGRLDMVAFATVHMLLAAILLGLYYLISFEVAVIIGLSILIIQTAQP